MVSSPPPPPPAPSPSPADTWSPEDMDKLMTSVKRLRAISTEIVNAVAYNQIILGNDLQARKVIEDTINFIISFRMGDTPPHRLLELLDEYRNTCESILTSIRQFTQNRLSLLDQLATTQSALIEVANFK